MPAQKPKESAHSGKKKAWYRNMPWWGWVLIAGGIMALWLIISKGRGTQTSGNSALTPNVFSYGSAGNSAQGTLSILEAQTLAALHRQKPPHIALSITEPSIHVATPTVNVTNHVAAPSITVPTPTVTVNNTQPSYASTQPSYGYAGSDGTGTQATTTALQTSTGRGSYHQPQKSNIPYVAPRWSYVAHGTNQTDSSLAYDATPISTSGNTATYEPTTHTNTASPLNSSGAKVKVNYSGTKNAAAPSQWQVNVLSNINAQQDKAVRAAMQAQGKPSNYTGYITVGSGVGSIYVKNGKWGGNAV